MKAPTCSCHSVAAASSFTSYLDVAQPARTDTTATLHRAMRQPTLPRTIDTSDRLSSWAERKHGGESAGKPVLDRAWTRGCSPHGQRRPRMRTTPVTLLTLFALTSAPASAGEPARPAGWSAGAEIDVFAYVI